MGIEIRRRISKPVEDLHRSGDAVHNRALAMNPGCASADKLTQWFLRSSDAPMLGGERYGERLWEWKLKDE
jgi:hypothetical protein